MLAALYFMHGIEGGHDASVTYTPHDCRDNPVGNPQNVGKWQNKFDLCTEQYRLLEKMGSRSGCSDYMKHKEQGQHAECWDLLV